MTPNEFITSLLLTKPYSIDYCGTHTTALAASYHLKEITQSERKLTKEEILNVNYFNKLTKEDFGEIIFRGIDENGDSVYSI